ncbi:MAG TPA: hypothetical protein PK640_11460 [Verrucomicrobiota bacterium]|nr:hypothetical protein [Verrucomicrobiota bacterium]
MSKINLGEFLHNVRAAASETERPAIEAAIARMHARLMDGRFTARMLARIKQCTAPASPAPQA